MEKSGNAFAVSKSMARRSEIDGAVSAPETRSTANCDQPAQSAKKVWSGFLGQVLQNAP
jgi:hypothetical protein